MQKLKSFSGNMLALSSYLMWGCLPLFWALLSSVDAFLILSYRVIFSMIFLGIILAVSGSINEVKAVLHNRRLLLKIIASAAFVFANWTLFIWGLNQGLHLDVSFGYFITPLFQVILGAVFLKEKVHAGTLIAFLLALVALVYMVVSEGIFPWLSVSLAVTFSLYGLIKKTTPAGAYTTLFLETVFSMPVCIGILVYFSFHGGIVFGSSLNLTVLFILSGIVTAVPLILYTMAAQKISLISLGFYQYISPTCMFLFGIFIFHDPIEPYKYVSFALIWIALLVYSVSAVFRSRSLHAKPQELEL